MAKEDEKPTAVDKGKGKAIDGADGSAAPEKDKDGKMIKDGQKKGDLPAGMSLPEMTFRACIQQY
jgi:26S proteasome regulatory subunit N1